MRRLLSLTTCLIALSSVASAYYHWTYFAQRSGPFQAMRKRFDLALLPDATVSFFISKQGPAKMVAGDNFPALVSQIRRAAEVWNVSGSELKVKFGGLQEKAFTDVLNEQVTPAIDVVFDDDLPPGVLAYSDPMTNTDLAYLGAANGPGFAPILRSRLQLASDLAVRSQASYSDAFFLTIVHEFGHTLGLQHSMTGGAMATSITRGTSRAIPLSADDVAGISSLYPSAQFKASRGSIEGHVNVSRNPANLASVVALSIDGTAVGAMTLPDGTYKIEGLPTGDYMVYAHPLPPAQLGEANPAGIIPPSDLQHAAFPATSEFQTRFYPNTKDWKEAARIHVDAGKTSSLVDFELDPLAGNGIYNLSVFGFLGANRNIGVHAPPLVPGFQDWLVFTARGALLPNSNTIAPGLQLSVISDVAVLGQSTLRNYTADQYLMIGAATGGVGRATPVAMTLMVGDKLYVLPNAFSVVPAKHPLISGVSGSQNEQGAWVATIAGENLNAATRVTFDGADALSVKANTDGTLTAIAPPAAGPQQAAVEVATPDGQTNWQLQGSSAPALFTYDAPADPSVSVTPGSVLAGTSAMLEINGVFTNFLSGKTAVGFGTSDITVRQMWVTGPDRVLVNVTVSPNAKLGIVPVTVSTGIQLVTLGAQLQVLPPDAKQTTLLLPIVNDATGLPGAPSGATISFRATGVPADVLGWSMIINGNRTSVTRTDDGRLLAPIALGIEAGPRPIQLVPASGPAVPPVWFQVDSQPPSISSVTGTQGLAASAQQKLYPGDRVVLTVSNLLVTNAGDGSTPSTKDDIGVLVAGIAQRVELLTALPAEGLYRVEFVIPADAPAGDAQPVVVRVGTRVSSAITIAIAAQADVIQ
ncbi:MAG: matrixin family metalloprotease [Bryobacteraceae bacterium]